MLFFLNALGSASLGGGVVILLLSILTPWLSRTFDPHLRYQTWKLLALVLLLVPLCSPLLSSLSIPHAIRLRTPAILQELHLQERTDSFLNRWGNLDPDSLSGHLSGSRPGMDSSAGQETGTADTPIPRSPAADGAPMPTIRWSTVLFLLWLAGALLHGSLVWENYLLFCQRVRRWSNPATPGEQEVLDCQCRELHCRRRPELRHFPGTHTPLLMGILHPTVLLPESMPEHVLAPALAHELTHLVNHHLVDRNLFFLVRTLHWFNPLVWRMARQAGEEQELCCDWYLVRNQDTSARRAYGQAILDQMTASLESESLLTTGFSGGESVIFRRFCAIMDRSPKRKGRATAVLLACVILLSQTLVSCQSSEGTSAPDSGGPPGSASSSQEFSASERPLLVLGTLNQDLTVVTGQEGPWSDITCTWEREWTGTDLVSGRRRCPSLPRLRRPLLYAQPHHH